jgi:hypothetical protein
MPSLPFAVFTFGDGLLTVIELAFMVLWIWIAIGVVFASSVATISQTGPRPSGCL